MSLKPYADQLLEKEIQSPTESNHKQFDELDYETWFKSNDLKKNMCTFVPFVHTSYVLINMGEDASNPVIPVDRLNLTEQDNKYQLPADPPLKKMCSGIRIE